MLYFGLNDAMYMIKDEFVMKVLIYFIGGLFIISGELSIGELLMFMSYMESMSAALDRLLKSHSDFLGQKAVFERLFAILDEEVQKEQAACPAKPSFSLKNVTFSYQADRKNILSAIDGSFCYGKKYLLVGQSGEGKSTLIKLLLGLNKANTGEILVDETPIAKIDSRSLLQKVGVVMQENMFFNLSIRENLQLIAPKASDEYIRKVMELACLDGFVDTLPQGLDTVIGERGIKLSGGQKQRLAIARLILHNPEVAILDEATSALDSVVESRIMDNLTRVFRDKTLIVISHKPLVNYRKDYTMKIQDGKLTIVSQ